MTPSMNHEHFRCENMDFEFKLLSVTPFIG